MFTFGLHLEVGEAGHEGRVDKAVIGLVICLVERGPEHALRDRHLPERQPTGPRRPAAVMGAATGSHR